MTSIGGGGSEISLWTFDQQNDGHLHQVTGQFPPQYLGLFQRTMTMNLVASFGQFVEKMNLVPVIGSVTHVTSFLYDLVSSVDSHHHLALLWIGGKKCYSRC